MKFKVKSDNDKSPTQTCQLYTTKGKRRYIRLQCRRRTSQLQKTTTRWIENTSDYSQTLYNSPSIPLTRDILFRACKTVCISLWYTWLMSKHDTGHPIVRDPENKNFLTLLGSFALTRTIIPVG
jgi:hypothetical protein